MENIKDNNENNKLANIDKENDTDAAKMETTDNNVNIEREEANKTPITSNTKDKFTKDESKTNVDRTETKVQHDGEHTKASANQNLPKENVTKNENNTSIDEPKPSCSSAESDTQPAPSRPIPVFNPGDYKTDADIDARTGAIPKTKRDNANGDEKEKRDMKNVYKKRFTCAEITDEEFPMLYERTQCGGGYPTERRRHDLEYRLSVDIPTPLLSICVFLIALYCSWYISGMFNKDK